MQKLSNCTICGGKLFGKQTKFCSILCKNHQHQSYDAQKSRGLKRKLEIINTFGGGCTLCGYNRNIAALSFHHTDPEQKEFKLDVRSLSNRTLKSVKQELEKCILICHNCHSELHNPNLNVDSLS